MERLTPPKGYTVTTKQDVEEILAIEGSPKIESPQTTSRSSACRRSGSQRVPCGRRRLASSRSLAASASQS